MICKKCGKDIHEDSIKCNFCGARAKKKSGSKGKKQISKRTKLALILSSVGLVIIAAAIIVIMLIVLPNNKVSSFVALNSAENYDEAYEMYLEVKQSSSTLNNGIEEKMLASISQDIEIKIDSFVSGEKSENETVDIVILISQYYDVVTNEQFNRIFEKRCEEYVNQSITLDGLYSDYESISGAKSSSIEDIIIIDTFKRIVKEYIENNTFAQDVSEYLVTFDIEEDRDDINEVVQVVGRIDTQRDNYQKAEDLFGKGNYIEAYKIYDNILEIDIYNYANAGLKAKECFEIINTDTFTKFNEMFNAKKYEDILIEAKAIKSFIEDNDDISTIIHNCQEEFKFIVLNEVDELLLNEDYDMALSKLDNLRKYINDSDVVDKTAECKEAYLQYQIQRINFLKGKVTIKYDKIDGDFTVVPKGYSTRYINISGTINVEPRLSITSNTSTLAGVFGFKQRDWIFFESIVFSYDGLKTSWVIDYFDRETQVDWGRIYEWHYVIYSEYDLGLGNLRSDLIDVMTNLAYADESIIRFSGDGYRDHTVTKSEKNNLKYFIELYNLLQANPSLYDELT